jgi:hypothetical protein
VSTIRRSVAVVLDGDPTPAWQQRALSGLLSSAALDVVEVRLAGRPRRALMTRWHAAFERRILQLGRDPLAPVLVEQSPGGRSSDRDLRTLVVWLAERPLPDGEPRELLYLRHGGRLESADSAFRRALPGETGGVETEVLLRSAGGTVLVDRTASGVRRFSITLGRDLMLWKLAALIPRAVERLPGLDVPAPASQPATAVPSTAALVARSAVAWPRILLTRLLFRRPWSIRVRERGSQPTAGWAGAQECVRSRRGHMYADPFLFEHEGRHHLFCEELPPGGRRAVISHTELHLDGTLADPPKPVLQEPHHLSYPFVFAHEGDVFMIPESSAVARVELYRAIEFPHSWHREATLLEDLDAADATLLADGERLWLFVGVAAPDASSLDELHLFSADALRGPWYPHAGNPVVSDVGCARPAGAILRWGSRLVRPGQDGSRRYGGAISFREIDELSSERYTEHEIARLEPGDLGDGARASHTYTADGRFEAIDVRRREPRFELGWPGAAARLSRRGAGTGGR